MSFMPSFTVGQVVSNSELYEEFKCRNMGGMRYSKATQTLVLISDSTKPYYLDRWDGKVINYAGQGKHGDQELESGYNRILWKAESDHVKLFFFEVLERTKYTYRGEAKLVGDPFQEDQQDEDGHTRKVWIFPLQVMGADVSQKSFEDKHKKQQEHAEKLTLSELKKMARKASTEKPSKRNVRTSDYDRNPYVAEYARRRANGVCQLCKCNAPFADKNGKPFLEVHHIVWLSNGGADSVANTVALCPNCHRRVHIISDPKDVDAMKVAIVEGE